MSSSTVTPYQFFEELRRVCPGKFGPNAVPGNINPNAWKALDLFSSIGNITHDVELTAEDCNMLPNFDTVEQVVRFVFAGVLASKNHKDILTQYNELEAVKSEAVKKLGYSEASLAIDTNPVLAVGIYLLYGYGLLDQLKPVTSTLSAIMEVSNLLPKEIREKYGEYVIYASMAFKKEIKEKPTGQPQTPQKPAEKPQQELPVAGEKKAKEEETKRTTLQDQVAELIDRALRYCNQVVKTKPGFPIPETVKMLAVTSLKSRLDRYGIKSFDVDAIDVQEVDCQTIYDEAVSNYESKHDGNRQYWATSGGGEIARKLAATLAEIIAERVGKEVTEEEAESMEEKYTEMGQEEEEKLSAVEDLLNELYSAVSGEKKRLGLKPDQIPDFLMEYLGILNQAGLSPQEYSELGKMFATFVQVAKEAGLSPKDYKGLLDRIIVLPPNVRKGIASAVLSILDKYSAGTIDANEAVSEIANLLGVKVGVEEAKPQEVEEVPQPPKVQPSPPRVPRVRRTERREEEVEEVIPPGTGEIPSEAREVLSRLDDLYRVIATRDQFWQYIRLWEITRALAFVYKGVMFVVPRLQPYSRMTPSNAKVIAYVNPPVIPKYESAVSQWAESTYGSAGYYNPLNFGKVVGAEVSIDIQREVLDFLVPAVKLTKYQDATLQLVTRLSKLGLCVFWVDIGRFYLIVENCSLTENIGSVYRMTKNGISLLQERV